MTVGTFVGLFVHFSKFRHISNELGTRTELIGLEGLAGYLPSDHMVVKLP